MTIKSIYFSPHVFFIYLMYRNHYNTITFMYITGTYSKYSTLRFIIAQ